MKKLRRQVRHSFLRAEVWLGIGKVVTLRGYLGSGTTSQWLVRPHRLSAFTHPLISSLSRNGVGHVRPLLDHISPSSIIANDAFLPYFKVPVIQGNCKQG